MNYKPLFETVLSDAPQFSNSSEPIGKNGARAFVCEPQNKGIKLWEIFGNKLEMPKSFRIAYDHVTNGLGYERRRINQLNSSSLLALLCFWNVSKENPITIKLNNDKVKFTKVYFEVESRVFDHNSSIDILLISEDNQNWLFLESKFTELLNPTNRYWLSEKYYCVYKDISEIIGFTVSDVATRQHKESGNTVDRKEFEISNGCKRYYGGIKQMISHIIGLLQGPVDTSAPHLGAYDKELLPNVILGAILYDFSYYDVSEYKSLYDNYVKLYEKAFSKDNSLSLISKISENCRVNVRLSPSQLTVLSSPLTYQEVFRKCNSGVLLENVSKFYSL